MGYNITRARSVAHRQIVRFGRTPANPLALGKLRRNGADRSCTVAIIDYKPHEKGLVLDGAVRALVSTQGLTEVPDHEQDLLIHNGKSYRLVAPDVGLRPGGVPIFHDLQVLYNALDAS